MIESCVVGLRKPDPLIYSIALDKLGVKGEEAVFLDDIGSNLKPAQDLGIRTIKVLLLTTHSSMHSPSLSLSG